MDAFQLLEKAGDVSPADDTTIEAATDLVLTAAFHETSPSKLAPSMIGRRRRRRMVLTGTVLVVGAAAALAMVIVFPTGGGVTNPIHAAPAVLTASRVKLISSESEVAMAESGTAVETTTNTNNGLPQGAPTTINVTFSGQNVNYAIAGNGNGAAGVENRVVDGQLYLYVKGPDLQMHWYHDTAANAAASESFPDPRTLLQAVSPSAGFENLGQQSVDGTELTHLRATTPGSIGQLGIPDVTGTVTSFDVWIDGDDVVRQMAVVSSDGGGGLICGHGRPGVPVQVPVNEQVIATLPDGKPVPPGTVCGYLTSGSTLKVRFANLGTPESVTAPSGASDEEGLG